MCRKFSLPSIQISTKATLYSVIPTSLISHLILYTKILGYHSLLSCFFPYIIEFDIKTNHQKIQATHLHASHCHHCKNIVNIVMLTLCYFMISHATLCLLSRIYGNTTKLFDIACILVATSMIMWRLECIF